MTSVRYVWRGPIDGVAVERLHAEGFGHDPLTDDRADWAGRLARHGLGWVTATEDESLVGFANVAWDGGEQAFVLDTLVAATHRRRAIGRRLVEVAEQHATRGGLYVAPRRLRRAPARVLPRRRLLRADGRRHDRAVTAVAAPPATAPGRAER